MIPRGYAATVQEALRVTREVQAVMRELERLGVRKAEYSVRSPWERWPRSQVCPNR